MTYEPLPILTEVIKPLETIDVACGRLADYADATGCMVTADFNGIPLIFRPGKPASRVIREWHNTMRLKGLNQA